MTASRTDNGKILNLDEVTAYDQKGKKIKPTAVAMSSNYGSSYKVDKCNDGKKGASSFCHSKVGDSNPNLVFTYSGIDIKIKKVVVDNRSNCCASRIVGANFRLCKDKGCKSVIYSGKLAGEKKSYTFNV